MSNGADNWYGIHAAVGTSKAQCILGLEGAWEDGLLLRHRGLSPRGLASFSLSEKGHAAWSNGTLGWTTSHAEERGWDLWRPQPEPWTLRPCSLCGRDLLEPSVGHLGDNWQNEECLTTPCCHVDLAEVRLSGSTALMDMHYTAFFDRGVLIAEYAT